MSINIKLNSKNFLSISDLTKNEIFEIIRIAEDFKNQNLKIDLKNKVLGMIFDKSSTRTRVSFQVAMTRLGGSIVELNSVVIFFTTPLKCIKFIKLKGLKIQKKRANTHNKFNCFLVLKKENASN